MQESRKNEYIELVQQHAGIIYKVIGLYVDNAEDKKDLHQEILLQSWKSFQNFKGKASFSTWLYKVSLNTVLNHHKKQKNHEELQYMKEEVSTSEQQENHEVLYQIIKSFNQIDRMLISLHLEGYKNQEVAEITGMTSNHINVKIHRLKAKIIEQFKSMSNG